MKKDERMKALRQEKIREIVENHIVETQSDLAERLRREDFAVTQATVSRDIKELMLVKVPMPTGGGTPGAGATGSWSLPAAPAS